MILSLTLLACGANPVKEEQVLTPGTLTLEQVKSIIAEAEGIEEPQRSRDLLRASQRLLQLKELDYSHRISDQVNPSTLTDGEYVELMLLKGLIALQEGEPYLALRFFYNQETDNKLNSAPKEAAIDLLDARATLSFDLADFDDAIQSRILLDEYIASDIDLLQLNHDLIWEALSEYPTNDLFRRAKLEKNPVKQGWFSLAALSKNNGANFRQQLEEINNWQRVWPEHPANDVLPADLQLILQLADTQAAKVAVMLPLSGKLSSAGNAILDGFMAAYYNDKANQNFTPEIVIYDTALANANALYDQAVGEGAELIIGPLEKAKVTLLKQRETMPVPVLALNNSDSVASPDELENPFDNANQAETHFYQFGLAIESEARQIAERAWKDGHRRAAILAPNSPWSDRAIAAFNNEWTALGGLVLDDRKYSTQRGYSSIVESLVAVDSSKQRRKQLQDILAANIEFEPRRRKDIDFIFLLAYSRQGQQIKPLLAFHYAGDIPVYSTSQIYSGADNGALNDLNGVRFSTMPWHFDAERPEKRAIAAYGDNIDRFQSLYAMGVDAYHVHPRLEQLRKISQASYYGSTGKLRVGKDNRIEREQSWAEIVGGKAQELKTLASSNEIE